MRKVAVITRTRSRPRLLERALKSILSQTMRELTWVVVNDGGEPGPVDDLIRQARNAGLDASAIHNEVSKGMEAASNIGIRASQSEYLAIHDDDDTWQPKFLDETTLFLEQRQDCVGVVTHAMRISEKMRADEIVQVRRTPHLPVLQAVHLADMAKSNLFPPISFLCRRSLFQELHGYDESMNVYGDWDFNLKALLVGDIGVIPKTLASYHVRVPQADADEAYGNSISPYLATHLMADAAFRNKRLREDIKRGTPGIGWLLALGRMQSEKSFAKTVRSKLMAALRLPK
jgi:glycosyltransferase involved in cell wall biosynthesis